MIVWNKYTGEYIMLPHDAYESEDAFFVPCQRLSKKTYELVEWGPKGEEMKQCQKLDGTQ